MATTTIKGDLLVQINKLPNDLQLRVLEYAKSLTPKGTPLKNLLKFKGTISSEDLKLMKDAIEEGCEKIDFDEW